MLASTCLQRRSLAGREVVPLLGRCRTDKVGNLLTLTQKQYYKLKHTSFNLFTIKLSEGISSLSHN